MEALMEEEIRANILLSRHPPQGLAGKVALQERGCDQRREHWGAQPPAQSSCDQAGHQGGQERTWSAGAGSWCSGHRATCRAGGTSGAGAGTWGAAPGYCQWSCQAAAAAGHWAWPDPGRRRDRRGEEARQMRSLLWT